MIVKEFRSVTHFGLYVSTTTRRRWNSIINPYVLSTDRLVMWWLLSSGWWVILGAGMMMTGSQTHKVLVTRHVRSTNGGR